MILAQCWKLELDGESMSNYLGVSVPWNVHLMLESTKRSNKGCRPGDSLDFGALELFGD